MLEGMATLGLGSVTSDPRASVGPLQGGFQPCLCQQIPVQSILTMGSVIPFLSR
jgi:hypothetical protein